MCWLAWINRGGRERGRVLYVLGNMAKLLVLGQLCVEEPAESELQRLARDSITTSYLTLLSHHS